MALNITSPISNFGRHLSRRTTVYYLVPGTVSPILHTKRPSFTVKGMYFTLFEYLLFIFFMLTIYNHITVTRVTQYYIKMDVSAVPHNPTFSANISAP